MRLYIFGETSTGEPYAIDVGFELLVDDRIETFATSRLQPHVKLPTKFALVDAKGIRSTWTRTVDEAKAFKLPKLTRAAERFRGTCEDSLRREAIIEPKEPWEHDILRLHQTRT